MSIEKENAIINLGEDFNQKTTADFISLLAEKHKLDPTTHFMIIADWVDQAKLRAAKAILDSYANRFNIDSITIRCTRKQYEEDINAFESGIKWEEIKE